jgi:hypothetical protein
VNNVPRRRCPRAVLWLSALLVIYCATSGISEAREYRTAETESLRIIFDSDWAVRTAPGYFPVRFDITNLGDDRIIEIVGQGSRYLRATRTSQPGGILVRQSIRLARGDRVRITLPVPVFADSENIRFEIRQGDQTIERFNYTGFQSGVPPADASSLIVADPSTPYGRLAAGWPRTVKAGSGSRTMISGTPSSGGTRLPPLDFILEPSRLPTNWLGYTSLRAVVIGPSEWTQLSEDQKNGLRAWTACGGDLFLADGDMRTFVPAASPQAGIGADGQVHAYFFGRVHTLSSEFIAETGLDRVLSERQLLQDDNWALPANRARDWGVIAARGFRLPIPGIEGVPARAYFSILIVFAVLIGPINYWILWRKRREVLFVLTAPFISAIFIVLLAGYVVVGEGLSVSGRVVSFTMLDEVRHQATTRATISLYAAGMTPGGGLNFPRDVAVFSLGLDGKGSRERQLLDLTEAQRFYGGMIQARSPANFEQIGTRAARERLTFTRSAAGTSVVNGFGATVKLLLYRSGNRIYSLRDALAEGGKATLKDGGVIGRDVVPADLPLSGRLMHLIDNQPEGSYIAVLERSPFLNAGMPAVGERDSFHVVIGWPGGQP